jgi:hypothetical protein
MNGYVERKSGLAPNGSETIQDVNCEEGGGNMEAASKLLQSICCRVGSVCVKFLVHLAIPGALGA